MLKSDKKSLINNIKNLKITEGIDEDVDEFDYEGFISLFSQIICSDNLQSDTKITTFIQNITTNEGEFNWKLFDDIDGPNYLIKHLRMEPIDDLLFANILKVLLMLIHYDDYFAQKLIENNFFSIIQDKLNNKNALIIELISEIYNEITFNKSIDDGIILAIADTFFIKAINLIMTNENEKITSNCLLFFNNVLKRSLEIDKDHFYALQRLFIKTLNINNEDVLYGGINCLIQLSIIKQYRNATFPLDDLTKKSFELIKSYPQNPRIINSCMNLICYLYTVYIEVHDDLPLELIPLIDFNIVFELVLIDNYLSQYYSSLLIHILTGRGNLFIQSLLDNGFLNILPNILSNSKYTAIIFILNSMKNLFYLSSTEQLLFIFNNEAIASFLQFLNDYESELSPYLLHSIITAIEKFPTTFLPKIAEIFINNGCAEILESLIDNQNNSVSEFANRILMILNIAP